jgi:hypothetical protein
MKSELFSALVSHGQQAGSAPRGTHHSVLSCWCLEPVEAFAVSSA